jgi:hypothetical protein
VAEDRAGPRLHARPTLTSWSSTSRPRRWTPPPRVAIFERFRERTRDQIAIVISHRFSTVRMADTIVVLDGGRVLERGSHDELVAAGGRYATLFALQARGYR